MRKRAFMISMFFSLFVVLAGVSAFAGEDRVKANIPFDFIAGRKMLPAGEYTIERGMSNQRDLLLIRSADNHHVLFLWAVDTIARETPRETDLVFNKVEDKYFLSRIWIAGEDTGREIPKPRVERELERHLAKNGQPDDYLGSIIQIRSE
jgi:hypothetical protein